jgi:hypothetical protein
MDPAEINFIRKVFIKERGAKVNKKSSHPQSCESPLKLQRHLVQLLAIWKQTAQDGGQADFLKTYAPLSLKKAFRVNLIFDRIHLAGQYL